MITAFITGTALGVFFFAGLWLTVKAALVSRMPALLTILSFFVRTAVVLLGFYFIAAGDWRKLLAALGGFIVGRLLTSRFINQAKKLRHEGGVV